MNTLWTLAYVAIDTADHAQAHALAARARSLADELGTAYALGIACLISSEANGENPELALAQIEEALAHWSSGMPRRIWVHLLINVGWYALRANEFGRARAALEESLADTALKVPTGIANAHSNLGLVALHEGDRGGAAAHFRQALQILRATAAKATIAETF